MLASRTQKSTSNALRAARPFVDRRPSELEVLPWCEGMSCLNNEAQQVHARVSLSESKPYRILCGRPGIGACIARLTKPTKRIEIYLDLYRFVHNQAKESQQVRKNLMIFSNYGTVDPSSANVCCSEYLK